LVNGRGLFVVLLAISVFAINCGSGHDARAAQNYQAARLTFQRGELNSALSQAEAGLRSYSSPRDVWHWRFYVLKAETLVQQGHSAEALALLDAELPPAFAHEDVAVRRKIAQGAADSFLQRFSEATAALDDAEQLAKIYHPEMLGDIALRRGSLAFLRGDTDEAESQFRNALNTARNEGNRFLEASALGSLALVATRRERYDEAIDDNLNALTLSQSLQAKSSVARILGNVSWNYIETGDDDRALETFEQAEKASGQLGAFRDQLVWLISIGRVYLNEGNLLSANEYFKRALALARQLNSNAREAECQVDLAFVALRQNNLDAAAQYNHEAMVLEESSGDRSEVPYSLLIAGRIAAAHKDYSGAAQSFQKLLLEPGADTSLQVQARDNLARTFDAEGHAAQAEEQYRATLSLIESARTSLRREEFRLSFLSAENGLYDDFADFLVRQKRPQDAMQVAELSRGRTLLDGLGASSADLTFPLKNFQPEATARRLNAVILSYWLASERSYLWAVTPARGTKLYALPGEAQLATLAQQYRAALTGPRDPLETNNADGRALYDILVAPARDLIPKNARVVIIADGALYGLNFETLIAPAAGQQRAPAHYWIDDVTVTNSSSLVLLAQAAAPRSSRDKNLLLIGNPVSPSTDYPSLPQAAPEIAIVGGHFDARQLTVDSDVHATPAAYLTGDPGQYSYIHFVAHGTASIINPLDSAIILTRQGGGFKLYARDIVGVPIHADLVTISSCFGAGSRAYSGEGLVGLSWAFLRAGAHNVIGALWEVSDTSTPKLMDEMYTELAKGADPAAALRGAKLSLLHSDNVYRKPFYWAPFQLYAGS
jgi:CHAT domain-containing protein/tetratricopeptide (TPR) repeat protein